MERFTYKQFTGLDRIETFTKALYSRKFEEHVFNLIKNNTFKYPLYLSAGEEYAPATIATYLKRQNIKPLIFGQHRGHSIYLSFDGNKDKLVCELLGKKTGCAEGMGGSASIQGKDIDMFGHDGLMGTQIPIAVGACHATNRLTLAICGDAAAEEDYVMSAIAWAGTKKLPILFIVTDNNLSILTEKSIRRNWEMSTFANSVNVDGYDVDDDPKLIWHCLNNIKLPGLINIRADRLFWHAGAGIDNYVKRDRIKLERDKLSFLYRDDIDIPHVESQIKTDINNLWDKHLEK